ncbi:hypothetical protein GGI20_002025 [Coemansia sp. BCRC 34301]|nr:hypothetical protein GGI20_002025 [Coemansia sp. BCRC 34301]
MPWARDNGVATSQCSRHKITDEALAKYSKYMERVSPKATEPIDGDEDVDLQMDTVGAVCIDRQLGIAHTTHSMGFGYMSEAMSQPVARISRKPESGKTTVSAVRL